VPSDRLVWFRVAKSRWRTRLRRAKAGFTVASVYVVSGRRLSSHFASSGLRLNDRPSDLHDNGHRLVSNLCESASTRTSTREYGTTTPASSCCFLPSRNNTVSSQQLLTPWRRLGKFNAKFDRVLRNNKLQKFWKIFRSTYFTSIAIWSTLFTKR